MSPINKMLHPTLGLDSENESNKVKIGNPRQSRAEDKRKLHEDSKIENL